MAKRGNVSKKSNNQKRKNTELNDPFYSKTNMEHLTKSIEQIEKGNGTSHKLIEI